MKPRKFELQENETVVLCSAKEKVTIENREGLLYIENLSLEEVLNFSLEKEARKALENYKKQGKQKK